MICAADIAGRIEALFVGRTDSYNDEAAHCVKEALTREILLDHLHAQRRIGPYGLIHENGGPPLAQFLTADFDGKAAGSSRAAALDAANRYRDVLCSLGVLCYVEVSRSGDGFHVWAFFAVDKRPTLASARKLGRAVLALAGLPDRTELYPMGKEGLEYGRTPYLPLWGFANRNRSTCLFVDDAGEVLPGQDELLFDIKTTAAADVERALAGAVKLLQARGLPLPWASEDVPPVPASDPKYGPGEDGTAWGKAVLRNACGKVGAAEQLHPTFNREAFTVAGYVAGGEIAEQAAREALRLAVEANPRYSERSNRDEEIERTLADAFREGAKRPLGAPPKNGGHAFEDVPDEDEPPAEFDAQPDEDVPEPEPVAAAEQEQPDEDLPPFPAECWREGFEQFRAAYTATTEASDCFLFAGYLVVAGLVLGRDAKLRCGVRVFPNAYVTSVGASGRSRKSTAQDFARSLLAQVDPSVRHSLGIGSPEGLLGLLCGDEQRKRQEDGLPPAPSDPQRVLIDLIETATLLRKGAQDATRGLLPFVVGAYDCPPSLSLPNRKDPLTASEPFLSIIGSTTAEWLRNSLTLDDVRGGLAGRFLYFVGQEKAPIPFPPPAEPGPLAAAERVLRAARDRHCTLREYPLAPAAAELWAAWYVAERRRKYPTPMLDCLAQRLHLHAWKLALVYAALEGTPEVTAEQLAAACTFADYQREAQAVVFRGLGDSETKQTEDRVLAALEKHGPLASWELAQRVRHINGEILARAIQTLARLERIEQRKQGRKRAWHLLGRAK